MDKTILKESFTQKTISDKLNWLNEPSHWVVENGLKIRSDADTDFWQRTHYGFRRDNGHFLYAEIEGDFRITTRVVTSPVNRYDQAGLMIRFDENNWLKTSSEFIPAEANKLGVVVTNNGYSDWSSQPIETIEAMSYRITRKKQTYYVDVSSDEIHWTQIRIAHLCSKNQQVHAGLYGCSPQGKDAEFAFQSLVIEEFAEEESAY
ncbi:regulation of enolase protein 1 (concanavalin A-like superfamily) [Alkalihalobacillus xiaoxiensis]|uniref:Regulation of enolase protein 1 (Concanavalin A-like superfamily) n=1 Tax=Shouchella xiaoxiensis TaxID=766895 RepID=A0ABS2STP3_9BACI|nr:DUF1349 domain-containing protein [Shouchella xiaoxiensis]MBM7838900.1 regulation of enolase protein 1 (concanavalin A-like superfamily) [Shouchella xiaoxiensis]